MSRENIINHLRFSDTTLREGRQSRGFHLSPDHSVEYAQRVDAMGIDFIELTHPGSSEVMADQVRAVNQLGLGIQVATHVRLDERDVAGAIATGVRNINTYIPMDPSSQESVSRSLSTAEKNISKIASMTSDAGVQLRVSVEHAMELPLDQLARTYSVISHTDGVSRVGIAETTGMCEPDEFGDYIQTVYAVTPPEMPLQIHVHNDAGLAAANYYKTLGILAHNGRTAIFDISVGGFGERNGILTYGDVFAVLYKRNKDVLKERYNIGNYADMLQFVQDHTGLPISYRDPLNPSAFVHSAGPHIAQMVKNSGSYQLINPEDFGFKRPELNVGHAVTGYQGMHYAASELGVTLNDTDAKRLAAAVRKHAGRHGPLTTEALNQAILNLDAFCNGDTRYATY